MKIKRLSNIPYLAAAGCIGLSIINIIGHDKLGAIYNMLAAIELLLVAFFVEYKKNNG